jgi:AcrR family transcriptional regulator
MSITLADIARELGVSKMTVSRAINNHPEVHTETRRRVLALVRQLNYRPNHHARALATRRSHLLGLVVPDLMHSYFAEIAKAIEAEARAVNYEVVICNTEESAATELREVEALRHRTDGLIIASAAKAYMIEVAGHTDSTGSEERNLQLSQQRAEAVIQYLAVRHKIPVRRFITPICYGKTEAIAYNTSASGRAQNRRVEVKMLLNRGLSRQQTTPSAARP